MKRRRARRPTARTRRSHHHHHTLTAPRTADELFALPEREHLRWEETTQGVSRMRHDCISLGQAAKDAQVPRATFLQLARSALRRSHGRWVAKSRDRMLRVFTIPAYDGRSMRELPTMDSREAAKVSRYDQALNSLIHGRDANAILSLPFTDVVAADGTRVPLLTDPAPLKRMAEAGLLSFESIYAQR